MVHCDNLRSHFEETCSRDNNMTSEERFLRGMKTASIKNKRSQIGILKNPENHNLNKCVI